MTHVCHAIECNVPVRPAIFMCLNHWSMLPRTMQKQLKSAYVPGQEIRKDPTSEYIEIAARCINYIAEKEGKLDRYLNPDL